MSEIRHERRVAAPPASVWKLLAQFDRVAAWAGAVQHSSALTAQKEGVGASRRVQLDGLVLVETATIWEPERRLAYELHGLPPMVRRVVNDWTIEADGAGSRVALTAHITPGPRPPMRLGARVIGRRIGAANADLLADLARAAEGIR